MDGEDVFRFGDTDREIGFHRLTSEALKILSSEQVELFNNVGYLRGLPGLGHEEIVIIWIGLSTRWYLPMIVETAIRSISTTRCVALSGT